MNHFLVTLKTTIGQLEKIEKLIVQAESEADAENVTLDECKRDELEPSDSGFFDLGGDIHLQVVSVQEVIPEHLLVLQHYLEGRPLPVLSSGKPHDDLLFAKYQGFYERVVEGDACGRTHPDNEDWSEAYDEGMNEAEEQIHKLEGSAPNQPDDWRVSWEIDLDLPEGATPQDAALEASHIAITQFMQLISPSSANAATKPALTVNGQLIDFDEGSVSAMRRYTPVEQVLRSRLKEGS